MKRYLLAHLAISVVFAAAVVVRAQAPPAANAAASSTINSIRVTGLQKFPQDQVIAASGLKKGDVVTAAQIQDATNQLAALGIFSTVNFHYTAKGAGIDLEFQVKEAQTYPISFDNFPWFASADIGEAIRTQVGLFTGEAPDSGTLIDEMSAAIENLLASKNIKGNVTHQLIGVPVGDGMEMQFRLEGVSLRVQSVKVDDLVAENSERLHDRLLDIKGQPYSLFAVELFEREQIRPLYVSKGFLKAQIGPPQTQLVPDKNDSKSSAVDIVIPVHQGAAYTWRGVSWQGNMTLLTSTLDTMVTLKPGDLADGTKVENMWREIELEYKRHGYLDMRLDADPQLDDTAHQVSYRVKLTEGAQYRMGDMIITGLSLDAEKRLRQMWQIAPGQIFDETYYDSHMTLFAKPSRDVFGDLPVHYNEFGHLLRPDTNRHLVDVLLDFK
ncbi:MAG TPA: POTRA domain-containing protein [Candidatus Acidoferrales bacterium]|nr:POTRA domain-containing protein [Candidatus Acidoferrales bacterium]